MLLTLIFAFLAGTIYGSFLNMLLWRLPEGENIGGRSHCRSCRHTLAWYDLVPIFSFLTLKGRCRYCNDGIHIYYPAVETAAGLTLAGFFFFAQPALSIVSAIQIFALLVFTGLFFFDLFYFILPDTITIPAIIIFALYDIFVAITPVSLFLAALLMTAFFAILYIASRGEWLGFGDVKLAALIGLVFGYPVGFMVILGGIWAGALFALILLIAKKATMKQALPFGSFLTLAAIACIIFQNEVQYFEKFFR